MKVTFPIPVTVLNEGPVQYNYIVYSDKSKRGICESQGRWWFGNTHRVLHIYPEKIEAGGRALLLCLF